MFLKMNTDIKRINQSKSATTGAQFSKRNGQEGQTASPCQIWSISVKPQPRYGYFLIFPRWWQSAILDLLCVCSDHPWRAFGGLYHCAKFDWNQWVVLIICMFFDFVSLAWKRLFTPQNWGFWGFYPLNGEQCSRNPKKAHPCASPRRLSHHAWKSVDASDL